MPRLSYRPLATGMVGLCAMAATSPSLAQSTPAASADAAAKAQPLSATSGLRPNLEGQVSTPLRYRPEGSDFVIRNGAEYFNRSLYGGHSAFRVDAGDKPEFQLYLPGRGGNLRLGIKTAQGVKWLDAASEIVARYRPGEMLYILRDPLIGPKGRIEVEVLADHSREGLLLRATGFDAPKDAELVFAYGGGNGERGKRDGDIGTERVPISQYFQFQPAFAADTRYALTANGFTADGKTAGLTGETSTDAHLQLADAKQWADAAALLASSADAPIKVVTGRLPLSQTPVYLSVQVTRKESTDELADYLAVTAGNTGARAAPARMIPAYTAAELAERFEDTRRHFETLRNRVRVQTPDPYLDASMGALNVAADAVWDEDGGVMHGAIAWRAKLLGWRGPYALDALGWHDRARANFDLWTAKQNTQPIPARLPPADEDANLARNEAGLHSNGDLSNTHYDMNVGFFDAMFRHLLWTGDVAYARQVWPVLERHLAWEKRLFRREYGPDRLPLYEAYASIWASDDIQYNGGGVAYQSAYNVYHNRMAARIARLIGKDPAPYDAEAEQIAKAMKAYLWMPERGAYAEFRDYLGQRALHPAYGVWSFYHTVDSGVPDAFDAARMAADLQGALKPLPVTGEGVPKDRAYRVLPSTDWMPYSWSINNVVMDENLHTALGLWQAGASDAAYDITLGALLASQYMGISPGNVGTMNYLDVYRREAQRDFADSAGVMSRAVVEGLFGVKPDALDRTLTLTPGFPAAWDHASLSHPDVGFDFKRDGLSEIWRISQSADRFQRFVLNVPARRDAVADVRVNGRSVKWTAPPSVGAPKLRIEGALDGPAEVRIVWAGQGTDAKTAKSEKAVAPFTKKTQGAFTWFTLDAPARPIAACPVTAPGWAAPGRKIAAQPVDLSPWFNDRVTAIFQPGKYRSPRSPFVSLALPAQGIGAWAGHVNAKAEIDDAALRAAGGEITPINGLRLRTPTGDAPNVLFTSQWDNYPREAAVPLTGKARRAYLLLAGSTNFMQSRLVNGEVVVAYADGATATLALKNPENWWPIERDYFIDDYQFRLCGEAPVRVDLKTGKVWVPGPDSKGRKSRESIDGGAANLLSVELDGTRTLKSLTVRALANEVVIGLMAISLER